MCPSIDIDMVIDICVQKNNPIGGELDSRLLARGLYVCLGPRKFSSQGNTFIMDRGIAMGSVLSPILANLYMRELEEDLHTGIKRHATPATRMISCSSVRRKIGTTF